MTKEGVKLIISSCLENFLLMKAHEDGLMKELDLISARTN